MASGPTLQNSMFRGDHNHSDLNACVGHNGNPGFEEYANGFFVAATVLLEKTISKADSQPLKYNLDEMIYPIVFTARHAVELRLKHNARMLQSLSDLSGRAIDPCQLHLVHDIERLFEYISNQTVRLDKRFKTYIDRLSVFIFDIAAVDPNGQTFRYPYDASGTNKHLEQVSLINLRVLAKKFQELEELLTEFHRFTYHLIEEYQQGTFTKKLSRLQLFSLATSLPPRQRWEEEGFTDIKRALADSFGVSGREFSAALNIIQKHYDMAPKIEVALPLKAATEADLEIFFTHWQKLHPPRGEPSTLTIAAHFSFDAMMDDLRISHEVIKSLQNTLSLEVLADLQALFTFARFPVYSEYYTQCYEERCSYLMQLGGANRFEFHEEIDYLVSKTNAFENILTSLYRLGQTKLALKLEQRYAGHLCSDDIDSIKSGVKFQPPAVLGY